MDMDPFTEHAMRMDELELAVQNYLSCYADAEAYTGDDDYEMLHLESACEYWRNEMWRLVG